MVSDRIRHFLLEPEKQQPGSIDSIAQDPGFILDAFQKGYDHLGAASSVYPLIDRYNEARHSARYGVLRALADREVPTISAHDTDIIISAADLAFALISHKRHTDKRTFRK